MELTAEISMYPFREDYKEAITDFIAALNARPSAQALTIETGDTATLIFGEYDKVFDLLREMLAWSHQRHGRAVFVTKFIPGFNPRREGA